MKKEVIFRGYLFHEG